MYGTLWYDIMYSLLEILLYAISLSCGIFSFLLRACPSARREKEKKMNIEHRTKNDWLFSRISVYFLSHFSKKCLIVKVELRESVTCYILSYVTLMLQRSMYHSNRCVTRNKNDARIL